VGGRGREGSNHNHHQPIHNAFASTTSGSEQVEGRRDDNGNGSGEGRKEGKKEGRKEGEKTRPPPEVP
jgi:hypothetical protein